MSELRGGEGIVISRVPLFVAYAQKLRYKYRDVDPFFITDKTNF